EPEVSGSDFSPARERSRSVSRRCFIWDPCGGDNGVRSRRLGPDWSEALNSEPGNKPPDRMKLRIQDNSLRLRLTQKEVARLSDQGSVDSAIHFPGERVLHYSVIVQSEADK